MKLFVSIPTTGDVIKTFVTDEVRELLASLFEVEYLDLERNITHDEFKKYVKDADVIMTGWGHPQITYDMIKGTNIKAIAHTGGSVGSASVGAGVAVQPASNRHTSRTTTAMDTYRFTIVFISIQRESCE
jgi:phosphoglycerate dehydrogenase-like enzyme